MKIRDIKAELDRFNDDADLEFSIDVESTNPEDGRRVFCRELVDAFNDREGNGGNVTICLSGEWNIPEHESDQSALDTFQEYVLDPAEMNSPGFAFLIALAQQVKNLHK